MQEIRSTPTREAILDTAESLFAQQGHEATSMRQITGAAGVNLASVNYHFGSKESLVQAVLKRRLEVLNRERMRLLDELEAQSGGKPLKPSQIVDAFFGTLLRLAAEVGLIPPELAARSGDAYRTLRRVQHQLRLQGVEKARVAPDQLQPERAAVRELWTTVLG